MPNAKRVRRNELYATSDAGSASPAPDHTDNDGDEHAAADLFKQRMSGLLDLDIQEISDAPAANSPDASTAKANDDEAGFEFNLFAPAPASQAISSTAVVSSITTTDEAPTHNKARLRIRLTPPPGYDAAGYPTDYKYKKQQRPLAYYLTSASDASTTEARRREYALAARDGAAIHTGAATPWPDGRMLDARRPWRVSVWLPSAGPAGATAQDYKLASEALVGAKKRTRVGKKTRIKRRLVAAKAAQRAADRQRRQVEEAAREAEKEEHLRRKKSELNRKKQIRKREKERERRAAAGLAGEDSGEHGGSE